MTGVVDRDLLTEVEQFLYREAMLLDDRRFDEWLDLFTEDTHYVMPTAPSRASSLRGFEQQDYAAESELAFFDDDIRSLRMRIARLATGTAWAEVPPSRYRHLITNVIVEPAESPDELAVRSSFLVYRHRMEAEVDMFCGHREDTLRRVEGDLKIARRRIFLAANVLPGKNLSIFF